MINYKFNENLILDELKEYIDATYDQHYSTSQFQTTEIVMDNGHGEGFCLGNVIKYVVRQKFKNGLEDLKKARWYLDKLISTHPDST